MGRCPGVGLASVYRWQGLERDHGALGGLSALGGTGAQGGTGTLVARGVLGGTGALVTHGSLQGYDTMKGFNAFSAPGDGDSLGGLGPQAFLGSEQYLDTGNISGIHPDVDKLLVCNLVSFGYL